jgi:chromosome segregation ATPase
MEYLMTGKTINETDDEIALLRQQQSILIDINKINQEMTEYYKKIGDCQTKLSSLKKEYNKIEAKKKNNDDDQGVPDNIDWDIPFKEEELPFD